MEEKTFEEVMTEFAERNTVGCIVWGMKLDAAHKREMAAKDAKIAELERRLKVAEGDPCNARDGEGSSLRIGWEGEKEYCVVAKYRQDLQVGLEDYDYHRVTGPLPLDIAKHWLAYHERIRTRSEDPKILVREVSKWRSFDKVEEGGVN